ncbi:MAG: hypothetical protein QOG04_1023 [Actinomycetota bacterium]|jgi:hypothetical protein|nr:hypothetical protein [Actinomycetota bacterium]
MSEDELQKAKEEVKGLKDEIKSDRKLIEQAADSLGEIDRGPGLIDRHADVLAALRIRLEGKPRAKLEDLLSAAGDIGGKKDLGDVLAGGDETPKSEWPEVVEKKRDWPGL